MAEALGELPELSEALRSGTLCWSAARELARVATQQTEAEWLQAARGHTVHEVERLVSGRRPGDRPRDPSLPEVRKHVLRFEVSAETYATYREAMKHVQQQTGGAVDDDRLLLVMAQSVLARGSSGVAPQAGAAANAAAAEEDAPTCATACPDPGRAPHQISYTLCPSCLRGRQEGGGELIDVPPETIAMARCDAQVLGPVDGAEPSRATQTVPPAIRRQVVRRDHGQCAVPGCRNSAFVSVHHLDLRSEGGGHDPRRMILLCGAHHRATHAGQLVITGGASTGLRFAHGDGTPYGEAPSPVTAGAFADAFAALRGFGFREGETRRALDGLRGSGQLGPAPTPEAIIKLGLRALRPKRSLPVQISSLSPARTPEPAPAPASALAPASTVQEPRTVYAVGAGAGKGRRERTCRVRAA